MMIAPSPLAGLGTMSTGTVGSLAPSPRSPKHTMQVSDIVDVVDVKIARQEVMWRHEGRGPAAQVGEEVRLKKPTLRLWGGGTWMGWAF